VCCDLIADVAVVGAGALGLSTALHCARLGRSVVVLDRRAPGAQASGRAAGLFKSVQGDEVRTFLARRSIEKVRSFPDWAGVPLDVAMAGSLLVARSPGHKALLAAEAGQSRQWGVELAEISPGEAAERTAGYYQAAGDEHVVWCPEDVYIEEPGALVAAYLAACQRLGVQVLAGEEVTGVRRRGGRVAGLETTSREVRAAAVVDAAGGWVRQVAELAGAWVAAAPVRHQLLVTEPLPDIAPSAPITRILDSAVYLRPARGGLMIGGFEADPLPVDPRHQPPGSTPIRCTGPGCAAPDGGSSGRLGPSGRPGRRGDGGGGAPRRTVHDEPRRPVPGRASARGARAVGGQRLQRVRFLLVPSAWRGGRGLADHRPGAGRAGRASASPVRPAAGPGPDRAGLLAVRALLRPVRV
jgi:glycine/D-amino acid oxidase-like deaminating enzyme